MTLNNQLRIRVEYIIIFNEHPPVFNPHHQSQNTHTHTHEGTHSQVRKQEGIVLES